MKQKYQEFIDWLKCNCTIASDSNRYYWRYEDVHYQTNELYIFWYNTIYNKGINNKFSESFPNLEKAKDDLFNSISEICKEYNKTIK